MKAILRALGLGAPLLVAALKAADVTVHETSIVPHGWQLIGAADHSRHLELSVALSQPRLGELKKRLAEISDPKHVDYGAHLTQAQVKEYQKPDATGSSAVLRWLSQAGIEDAYLDYAWIRFNATVSQVNSLLRCELEEYGTPRDARVYRTTEYSLPTDLSQYIQFVYPVSQFIDTAKRQVAQEEDGLRIRRRQDSSKGKLET